MDMTRAVAGLCLRTPVKRRMRDATYTITLAHDVSYYGKKDVEANTWEEAVASLTDLDWGDNCFDGDSSEYRVCDVEDESGDTLASDFAFDCHTVLQMGRHPAVAGDTDRG
jgi:hypothetical protein